MSESNAMAMLKDKLLRQAMAHMGIPFKRLISQIVDVREKTAMVWIRTVREMVDVQLTRNANNDWVVSHYYVTDPFD